jgi:hypothetical protein
VVGEYPLRDRVGLAADGLALAGAVDGLRGLSLRLADRVDGEAEGPAALVVVATRARVRALATRSLLGAVLESLATEALTGASEQSARACRSMGHT